MDDFEVAVLGSPGPVVPTSLSELEANFDRDLAQSRKDRAYFGIEVDDELIGEAGLHQIDHFNRGASSASRSAASTGGRASGKTGPERWWTTPSST